MSPVNRIAVLAMAASVLAVPQHNHAHDKFHSHSHLSAPSGSRYSHHRNATASRYSGSGRSTKVVSTVTTTIVNPAGYGGSNPWDVAASSAATESGALSAAAASSEPCTDDITITTTDRVTIYVTASEVGTISAGSSDVGAASAGSVQGTTTIKITSTQHVTATTTLQETASTPSTASSASSSEAAPVSSAVSSEAAPPPVYSIPTTSSVVSQASQASSVESVATTSSEVQAAAPTTSSVASSPAVASHDVMPTSSPSSTVEAAPTTTSTTSSAWNPLALTTLLPSISIPSWSTSSAAPSSTASSSSGGSGKRGLAYNDASLTSCFSGSSQISWAYNWGSSSSGFSMPGVSFIPNLWGPSSDFTGSWLSNAKSAISSGSKVLFSFNEPDEPSQSNLSPAAAAAGFISFMNPLSGLGAHLCAPSVTNGGGSMGLTWLSNFLSACPTCNVDCFNIHFYADYNDGVVQYFKDHVTNATQIANGKPLYVGEFGINAGATDAQIQSFLEEVMPWMDSNPAVTGYAYYMVANNLLVSGSEPSSYGATFKSYTS